MQKNRNRNPEKKSSISPEKNRSGNSEKRGEVLFGFNPVIESLRAGKRAFTEVYIAKGKGSERTGIVEQLARSRNIPVVLSDGEELKELTGNDMHQGVAAAVGSYPFSGLDRLFSKTRDQEKPPFFLLLDSIEDPHNLGALIRTALCAGVDGIVIPKDRSAAPTPVVSKTSAGALEHVDLVQVTNLVSTIKEFKKNGIWIAGLDAGGDSPLYSTTLDMPLGVVVGGEGRGLRTLVRKNCDFILSVPQNGPVDSLNASVAGAVVMYEVLRQKMVRQASSIK